MSKNQEYFFIEIDKKGAEWVVVAYLCGSDRMIEVVESGKSPHIITGSLMSGLPEEIVQEENNLVGHVTDPELIKDLREPIKDLLKKAKFTPRTMSIRQCGKKSNHGLNYDEAYKTFALINEIEESEAKKIINLYKKDAYPEIPLWHDLTRRELKNNGRILKNCFGRPVRFIEPWGGDLFRAAYAFKPQSTVSDLVKEALLNSYYSTNPIHTQAILSSENHDSLLYQYPCAKLSDAVFFIQELIYSPQYLNPRMEYYGRSFRIASDLKVGFAWGEDEMLECPITEDYEETLDNLKVALDNAREKLI